MSRTKQARFSQLHEFNNVLENDRDEVLKGVEAHIKKYSKVIVELAAGRGEYTVGLAKLNSDTAVIGVDIQGERLWYGATQAQEEGLDNVLFVRAQIDILLELFPPSSIDEIWITFADPFPRTRQESKRLTSIKFLEKYKKVLKADGVIHLKTDSELLLESTLKSLEELDTQIFEQINNIYLQDPLSPELSIQTYFEKKHLEAGRKIKYLRFGFS